MRIIFTGIANFTRKVFVLNKQLACCCVCMTVYIYIYLYNHYLLTFCLSTQQDSNATWLNAVMHMRLESQLPQHPSKIHIYPMQQYTLEINPQLIYKLNFANHLEFECVFSWVFVACFKLGCCDLVSNNVEPNNVWPLPIQYTSIVYSGWKQNVPIVPLSLLYTQAYN